MTVSSRDQEILDAYEEWRVGESERTTAELAEDIGISRQRLYQVLAKHEVRLKTGERSRDDVSTAVVSAVGEAVLDQLMSTRAELAEYRERYGPLTQG